MNNIITRLFYTLFRKELDFRIRIFNQLALGGIAISFIMAALSGIDRGNL